MGRSAAPDVCVVGAGVIGLSSALALSQAGLSVSVLDAGYAGQASWAGGGILSTLPPDADPGALRDLLTESLRLYPAYCAGLEATSGIDPEYWICGGRWVDARETRHFPDLAQVRNTRLIKALRRTLEERGVSLRSPLRVLGLRVMGGDLHGLDTDQGFVESRHAVIAAGAWSGQIASVDVRPAKGQMLLLQGEPAQLREILLDEQVYLVPRRDGRILIGSTVEDTGFDVTPSAAAKEKLLAAARRLWPPCASLPVAAQWAGLRPMPMGEIPIIESSKDVRGLYFNTGHFRIGITLAPASAQRLCDLVLRDL